MSWKVKKDSSCGECEHPDYVCHLSGIPDHDVFLNYVSGKAYAFIHDQGECGCMCEVESE